MTQPPVAPQPRQPGDAHPDPVTELYGDQQSDALDPETVAAAGRLMNRGVAPESYSSPSEEYWRVIIHTATQTVDARARSGAGKGRVVRPRDKDDSATEAGAPKPATYEDLCGELDGWVTGLLSEPDAIIDSQNTSDIGTDELEALRQRREVGGEIWKSVGRILERRDVSDELAERCAEMRRKVRPFLPETMETKIVQEELHSSVMTMFDKYRTIGVAIRDVESTLRSLFGDRRRAREHGQMQEEARVNQRIEILERNRVRYLIAKRIQVEAIKSALSDVSTEPRRIRAEKALLKTLRIREQSGGSHTSTLEDWATTMKGAKLELGLENAVKADFAAIAEANASQGIVGQDWGWEPATVEQDVLEATDGFISPPPDVTRGATLRVRVDGKASREVSKGIDDGEFIPLRLPSSIPERVFAAKRNRDGVWVMVVNVESEGIGGGLRQTGDNEIKDSLDLNDPVAFASALRAAIPAFLAYAAAHP